MFPFFVSLSARQERETADPDARSFKVRFSEPYDTGKRPALPGSQVTPVSTCNGLRPRWCPEYSPRPGFSACLTYPGLLPSARSTASAFPSGFPEVYPRSATIPVPGLGTEPAPSPSPASDARCRVCLRGRLHSGRVGLSLHIRFIPSARAGPARGRVTNPHSSVPEQTLQEGVKAITH